jgi:transposase
MSELEVEYLLKMRYDFNGMHTRRLARQFQIDWSGPARPGPSESTIARLVRREYLTRKGFYRIHNNYDPGEALHFMDRMSTVPALNIVDIDGMTVSRRDFEQTAGWSRRGQQAIRMQISIRGVSYPVMAAYTPLGFIAHEIYGGSVGSDEFVHFIRERVAPMVVEGDHAIVDNATHQKTQDALTILDQVFYGRYDFASPYSPRLKPIERGFANIKRWIRDHEIEASADPIGYINEAFRIYGVLGERGHVGKPVVLLIRRYHTLYSLLM